MAYKFKNFTAIEQDKKNLDMKNSKMEKANSLYGSDVMGTFDPSRLVNEMISLNKIEKISLSQIKVRSVNEFATISNETLKKSILKIGLISPIIVRKSDNEKYIIISGHRRYSAFKEIHEELINQKLQLEKDGKAVTETITAIEKYSAIPCIVFTMVDNDSDLLGKGPQYITSVQEEEMYKAANLENRQISRKDLTKHIMYFYNMIKEDPNYKNELLKETQKNAIRKPTNLNYPKIMSQIITKDLGFSVAPSYIWQLIKIIEGEEKYPKYHKIAMKRLENDEKVKTIYNDLKMASEIHNSKDLDAVEKREYETRIEKGTEPIIEIYNEAFNIKDKNNDSKMIKSFKNVLFDIRDNKITLEDAITNLEKYLS